jgi:hypothetical protein
MRWVKERYEEFSMTNAKVDLHSPAPTSTNPQTYAKIAGVLLLLTIVAGGLGEVYIPSKLIAGNDATATANNIRASMLLFRTGFGVYLVEAVCDVTLALIFYVLLRPVHRELALLAAFFGLVSTAVFAVAEFFYFTALIFLRSPSYLAGFSPEQLNSLSMYSLKMYAYGGGIFAVFYGIASVLRGYLIARSGYLPKFLGILLIIAGAGFILKNAALVLAPAYASDVLLLPMFLAAVSMTGWFLLKGIDLGKWEKWST